MDVLCFIDFDSLNVKYGPLESSDFNDLIRYSANAESTLVFFGKEVKSTPWLLEWSDTIDMVLSESLEDFIISELDSFAEDTSDFRLISAVDLSSWTQKLLKKFYSGTLYLVSETKMELAEEVPVVLLSPGILVEAKLVSPTIEEAMAPTTKKETVAERNARAAEEYRSLELALNASGKPATGIFELDELTKRRTK